METYVWNQPLIRWLVERLDSAPEGTDSELCAARLLLDLQPPVPGDVWDRCTQVVRGRRP